MKMVKDRYVVVGADFAGFPLKETVKEHLEDCGWTVTDVTPILAESDMYHRVGFKVGAQIAEGHFEKALVFCGSGMGIHVAASKVPGVHAAVCESVTSALRASTANNCNLLAMGAFYVAPQLGKAMADAFLNHALGDGYENWKGFYEYHKIGFDECEDFDYAAYKANSFRIENPPRVDLGAKPSSLVF